MIASEEAGRTPARGLLGRAEEGFQYQWWAGSFIQGWIRKTISWGNWMAQLSV